MSMFDRCRLQVVAFLREERAAASAYIIVALPILLILCGLGIDSGSAYSEQMVLQNSADAAALAGALVLQGSPASVPAQAQQIALLNLPSAQNGTVLQAADVTNGNWNSATQTYTSCGSGATSCAGSFTMNAVRVLLRREQSNGNAFPIAFLQLMGWDHWNISAVSIAIGKGQNICIVALDPGGGKTNDIHTIFGGTNANVTIGGNCAVADNTVDSNGPPTTDSVDVKSGASLNFNSLYIRDGGVCDGNTGTCAGALQVNGYGCSNSACDANLSNSANSAHYQTSQAAITDPYASRTLPAATGTCDHTNFTASTTQALNPGYYCGTGGSAALTVSNPGPVNLNCKNPGPGPGGGGGTCNGITTVLSFASTTGVTVGMTATDTTKNHTTAIPAGDTVTAVTSTTVTLQTATTGGASGLANNDVISFSLATGTTVTLNPGVYILDGKGGGTGPTACSGATKPSGCLSGDLIIIGGAIVTGSGVTIVLTTSQTGSNVGVDIGQVLVDTNSSLTITAPTTSVVQNGVTYQVGGIAIWQDPRATLPSSTDGNMWTAGTITSSSNSATAGVSVIGTGSTTAITGVVYLPHGGLLFSGGNGGSSCTQLVAWAISFLNSAQFNYPSSCSTSAGTSTFGASTKLAY
jgi:Flp pilus assembly protein TadG